MDFKLDTTGFEDLDDQVLTLFGDFVNNAAKQIREARTTLRGAIQETTQKPAEKWHYWESNAKLLEGWATTLRTYDTEIETLEMVRDSMKDVKRRRPQIIRDRIIRDFKPYVRADYPLKVDGVDQYEVWASTALGSPFHLGYVSRDRPRARTFKYYLIHSTRKDGRPTTDNGYQNLDQAARMMWTHFLNEFMAAMVTITGLIRG